MNNLSLARHIRDNHKLSSKEYYDIYIGKENSGICIECGKETKYRSLNKGYSEFCSKKCSSSSKQTQSKSIETCQNRYGVEHYSQTEESTIRSKETCQNRYGVDSVSKLESVKEKRRATNQKKYGVDYYVETEEFKEKIEESKQRENIRIQEIYGVDYYVETEEFKEKSIETCQNRYGVEHYSQTDEFKEKARNRSQEIHGTDSYFETDEFKEKARKTKLEKYNDENYTNSEKKKKTKLEKYNDENYNNREKFIQTCQERYDVDNPTQNAKILEKAQKYSRTNKKYTCPSGKTIIIQGYEYFALDILFEKYEEIDILTDKCDVPKINYIFNDKNKVYFPDIYIPSKNLIIEVKSGYTFEKELDKNLAKQEACISEGYNFKFLIFDGKGNLINNNRK